MSRSYTFTVESVIVYCEECGQASGYAGESPAHLVLAHSDTCLYNVEDPAECTHNWYDIEGDSAGSMKCSHCDDYQN
jgi:hypothetical protein